MPNANRSRPRHSDPMGNRAHAPYNFVPLPEHIVTIDPPPDQDSYEDSLSGYIDCEIKTMSPTYIRGMINIEEYREIQSRSAKELLQDVAHKNKMAKFSSYGVSETKGKPTPIIPGSSIRGMIRSLVEIISYSRIHDVADKPQIWFRDVAQNYPTGNIYSTIRKKLVPGYLKKSGSKWEVEPALQPKDISNAFWPTKYFLVDNQKLIDNIKSLPDLKHIYHPNYKLQRPYHIWFSAKKSERKRYKYNKVTKKMEQKPIFENDIECLSGSHDSLPYEGWLVTTGNMGHEPTTRNRRRFLPVVLAKQQNSSQISYELDEEAVRLYVSNLTKFQEKNLEDQGCLWDGNIIFFCPPENDHEKVRYFGHNPYPRIPLLKNDQPGKLSPIGPLDMVPDDIKGGTGIDISEAIFGVESGKGEQKKGFAGRVSFSDGILDLERSRADIWFQRDPQPYPPKILASPKPTSYQLYLVQDGNKGHDPDNKNSLAHYGSNLDKTEIRGHKNYWPQGHDPDFIEDDIPEDKEDQYTRILALNTGVVFKSRVRFNNLRREELGALLWALSISKDEQYVHRIGMGKPYGLGSIKITPTLVLSDRKERYHKLFDISDKKIRWYEPEDINDESGIIQEFEQYIKNKIKVSEDFQSLDRIKTLLLLMSWKPNLNAAWKKELEYMALKTFNYRNVLPNPAFINDELSKSKENSTN